jgi:MOSC domain-containing protein YiiM
MFRGRVVAIYVTATAGAPMEARATVDAVTAVGLTGDRYALGTGRYSDTNRGPRDVTLIEREAVDAVREETGIDVTEADTRRNVVTEGVPLNHLVGRTFSVGAVVMRGLRLSEPCAYLEQITGLGGVHRAFVHRGGLRAEMIHGGTFGVGDPVELVELVE